MLADDPTFRIALPRPGGSGSGRAEESAIVMEDGGTIIGQSLSSGGLMHRDRQPAGGGWRYRWNDGTQAGRQDVYFLDDEGSLRNPDGESPDDAPLYNVAGVPLDMTWGDYRGAEARSLLIVSPGDEPTSTFIVNMSGLVPGGVYSLYYTMFGPDSEHPLCSNALRDLPLTSIVPDWQRPDPSSFVANRRGSAFYIGQVEGDVLAAMQSSVQVIYHAE